MTQTSRELTKYYCGKCGHRVADPRDEDEWVGTCSPESFGGCHKKTTFVKLNGN